MKMVIYDNKTFNEYNVTSKKNYNSYVQNARKIHCFKKEEWTIEEIISYYCRYFECKQDDFEIIQ